MISVRAATEGDIVQIAALAARRRRELEQWEPDYWRVAPDADERHERFLRFIVASADHGTHVAESDGAVTGFAASTRQPPHWFVDDLCTDGEAPRRIDIAVSLLQSFAQRPAVICVPRADGEGQRAVRSAGLALATSYFRIDLRASIDRPALSLPPARAADIGDAPAHTFHPARLVPVESMLTVGDEQGGYGVASPSIPAPPVYEPGGTTCVIDRVRGADRPQLLAALLHEATSRGDAQAIVVIDAADDQLRRIVEDHGAHGIVDVHRYA